MSDMTLQAVKRRKKRRDRWMPGNAAELLRRGATVAAQVLPGFLLSFAEVLGMPAGMQAGWLAAMAVMGESLLLPSCGCALAFAARLLWGLPLRLEQLITLGLMLLSPAVLFRKGAWLMMGWTALALLPTAVRGALSGTAAEALQAMGCMALSTLSAPLFLRGIRAVRSGRCMDGTESRVAVGYAAGMLLCGGGRMLLLGLNVGVTGAALGTLCLGMFLGVAAGTVGGMTAGLVLALDGLPVSLSVALSVGGFLAGMVQGLGRRWLTCLSFALGCGLTMVLSGGMVRGGAEAVGVSALALALCSRSAAEGLQRFFRRFLDTRPSAGDAYAAEALAEWEKTVEAMAGAAPMPGADEEERTGAWWKEHLCCACPDDNTCPCMLGEKARRQAETVWATREEDDEAFAEALENLRGLGCARLYHLREGMTLLRARDAESVRQTRRARYQRDMLVTHLTAMAGAARRFAQMSSGESWWDQLSADRLRRRLSELAYPATLIYARRVEGHAQVAFELHRTAEAARQAEELRVMASQVLDIPMETARIDDERVLLRETPLWSVEAGMAACGLDGGTENGDTYWLGRLGDGRYLAALSDGMGHGKCARKESAETVTLLRLCLEAGYTRPQALTAVNGMMLLASGGERFSTVDIAAIDLWTGHAALDKLGAAAGRLVRGRNMMDLTGDALPLGILETVESRTSLVRLRDGDELWLMTDGVEDAFGDKAALDEAIRMATSEKTAQAEAEGLLRMAKEASAEGRKDDMTVLVMRMTRPGNTISGENTVQFS